MRPRVALLPLLALSAFAFVPLFAHAQAIPFFGPVIPPEFSQCALSFSALITVINNIIRLLITLGITILAPIMIAYAGFLLVVNPFNPGAKSEARSMLLHVVIGIVIALVAYALVAALMAVLYDANAPGLNGTSWSDIINGAGVPSCLTQAGTPNAPGVPGTTPTTPGVTTPTAPGAPILCVAGNTACSPSALSNLGATGPQSNALSCIAMTESTGGKNIDNNNYGSLGPGCNSSNHCGLFQLSDTLMTQFGPSLGCTEQQIINDANDCNARVAIAVVNAQGYGAWTGQSSDGVPWNPTARSCVTSYDNTTTKPGFVLTLLHELYTLLAYATL